MTIPLPITLTSFPILANPDPRLPLGQRGAWKKRARPPNKTSPHFLMDTRLPLEHRGAQCWCSKPSCPLCAHRDKFNKGLSGEGYFILFYLPLFCSHRTSMFRSPTSCSSPSKRQSGPILKEGAEQLDSLSSVLRLDVPETVSSNTKTRSNTSLGPTEIAVLARWVVQLETVRMFLVASALYLLETQVWCFHVILSKQFKDW